MHAHAAVKNGLGGMAGSAVQISADSVDPLVTCGAIAACGRSGGMVQLVDSRFAGSFMTGGTVVDRLRSAAVASRAVVESVVRAVVMHGNPAVARFTLMAGRTVESAVGDACVAGGAIVSCGKLSFVMHSHAAVPWFVRMAGNAVKL